LVALDTDVLRLEDLVGRNRLDVLAKSGGKSILTNHPLAVSISSARSARLSGEKKALTVSASLTAF